MWSGKRFAACGAKSRRLSKAGGRPTPILALCGPRTDSDTLAFRAQLRECGAKLTIDHAASSYGPGCNRHWTNQEDCASCRIIADLQAEFTPSEAEAILEAIEREDERILMSNSQRLRARVPSAVKWLVIIPIGIALVVLAALSVGYWGSFLGTL